MPKTLSLVITIFAILIVLLLVLGLLSIVPTDLWDWIDRLPTTNGAYFALGAILVFIALGGSIIKYHKTVNRFWKLYNLSHQLCDTVLFGTSRSDKIIYAGRVFRLLKEIDPERLLHQNNHQKGA